VRCTAPRGVAVVWALVLALAPATPAAALEVPFLSGRVVDLAELLPPATEQELDGRLAELESETGAQVVVLTVPTLEGEVLEDYAGRVAGTWKLGREGIDDGVLLLVAREERGLRLEVGYGLEGKIPDITGKRILDELVVPRFRDGDFPGGIAAGVDAVATAVQGGEPLPPPVPAAPGLVASLAGRSVVGAGLLLFFFPFAASALFTRGGAGWFQWLFLIPFLAIFPFAFLGRPGLVVIVLWLVVFPSPPTRPTSTPSPAPSSRPTPATARSSAASRASSAGTPWRWWCAPTARSRHRRPHLHLRLGGHPLRGRLQPLLPRPHRRLPGDLVYFQGHASPGIYARAFLEGRLSGEQLENFRRELRRAAACPPTRTPG
jgi:uncharacterized protein